MQHAAPILFDRARLRKRAERAADRFCDHDFLWREAAARAEESLSYIARGFPTAIAFGAPGLNVQGCTRMIHAGWVGQAGTQVVADEECLPFAENSADAFISLLGLHWVNDVPGTLAQIRRILKPDGLFFAILPGGETLRELRSIFARTETAQHGGISPRVAPFIDVRDAGALLQRAGFALPVADSEVLQVSYPHVFALMADLRGAGQANMLHAQAQHFTPKKFFTEAAARYAQEFSDTQNRITATVEFITLTGWKPADNQQKPAKRGSGKTSLRDALA